MKDDRTIGAWCRALGAAVLVLALQGCSEKGIRENLAEEGRPPAYIDGYIDGCRTGLFRAGDERYGHIKDAARYRVEIPYRQGWDRGVDECAKGQRRLQEFMEETGY
jgi:hypothetical protein